MAMKPDTWQRNYKRGEVKEKEQCDFTEGEEEASRIKGLENKAGYTAQDAPSMRTFHLR